MAELLYTSDYVKPGCYIGQLIEPSGGSLPTAPRIPLAIGKGSRFAVSSNAEVVRAFVYDESVEFSTTSPYEATLAHPCDKDQDSVTLVRDSDGSEIPENKWYFKDAVTIVISEDAYGSGTFTVSYQSTDTSIEDATPVNDVMSFTAVGDTVDSGKYAEGTDFFLVTNITDKSGIIQKSGSVKQTVPRGDLWWNSLYSAESLYPALSSDGIVKTVGTGNGTFDIDVSGTSLAKKASVTITVDYVTLNADAAYSISSIVLGLTCSYAVEGKAEAQVVSVEAVPGESVSLPYGLTVTPVASSGSLSYGTLSYAGSEYAYTLGDASYDAAVFYAYVNGSLVSIATGGTGTSDVFTAVVLPGRIFPTAKDNRTCTVKLVTKPVPSWAYSASTPSYTGISSSTSVVAPAVSAASAHFTYAKSFSVTMGALLEYSDGMAVAMFDVSRTLMSGSSWKERVAVSGTVAGGLFEPTADAVLTVDGVAVTLSASNSYDMGTFSVAFAVSVENSGTSGEWYYNANTQEGGFGTVSFDDPEGELALPGNLLVEYDTEYSGVAEGDVWSFDFENENLIDWSLTLRTSESFTTSEVKRDVKGTVTGTSGTYYVILEGSPLGTPSYSGLGSIVATVVTDDDGNNTSYVSLSAKPTASFTVTYEYSGNEPEVGATYYVSSKHMRPDSYYNTPYFISSRADGEKLLAPATPDNDLFVANEIAWDVLGNVDDKQVAFIQIQDSDDDGEITSTDVKNAIDAVKKSKKLTDWTLLSYFDSLSYFLKANQNGNDPFELRENEVWIGCPAGYSVGDADTEGTLVHTAETTLKVTGDDPAHGTRMLVGSTYATKSIDMYTGTTQSVTVDGSFIAWSVSVLRSGIKTGNSILRQQLGCFDTMEVQSETDNNALGAAQVIYFSEVDDGVYRIEEDFTVDSYSFEFSLEQITSQRLTAVRRVREFVDENLVGYAPDTPQAGVATVIQFIGRALRILVKDGTIAPYQDDDGNKRELDTDTDIYVTYVSDNPTQYQFGFGFYTRKVMKQFFGTYVVDKTFSSTGLGTNS